MKFRSKYPDRVYVVQPADYMYDGRQQRRLVRGLRVEFRAGFFDSVRAQERNGWTDEERDIVEHFLLNHDDFNRHARFGRGGLYLDDAQDPTLPAEVKQQVQTADAQRRCILTIRDEDGIEQCGNQAAEGSDYCEVHQRALVGQEGE